MDMSTRMIQMARIVDAPPDRVYRAWSDAETVRQWLASSVEGSLLPGVRSALVFPRHRIEVDVLEADPNSRFRFRWAHPLEEPFTTEVTVIITPIGYGSRVSLSDGPYDVADETILDEYARAIEIWAAALTQLRASVDYSVDLRKER
jgi:uncharacterized protein YndB with AHSA1/START domain